MEDTLYLYWAIDPRATPPPSGSPPPNTTGTTWRSHQDALKERQNTLHHLINCYISRGQQLYNATGNASQLCDLNDVDYNSATQWVNHTVSAPARDGGTRPAFPRQPAHMQGHPDYYTPSVLDNIPSTTSHSLPSNSLEMLQNICGVCLNNVLLPGGVTVGVGVKVICTNTFAGHGHAAGVPLSCTQPLCK